MSSGLNIRQVKVVCSLSLMSWLALATWSNSSYQNSLNHGDWRLTAAQAASHHVNSHAHSLAGMLSSLLVGGTAWMLMVAAMMLPAIIPALRNSKDQLRLGALLFGYLNAWLVYGVVAHTAGGLVNWVVGSNQLLSDNGWLISVSVLVLAGLYQLSERKSHCLQQCNLRKLSLNSNTRFFTTALAGWHYGLRCIGCCWAVMLLMFVAWPGNVLWMFVLSILMVAERFSPPTLLRLPLATLYLLAAAMVATFELV